MSKKMAKIFNKKIKLLTKGKESKKVYSLLGNYIKTIFKHDVVSVMVLIIRILVVLLYVFLLRFI